MHDDMALLLRAMEDDFAFLRRQLREWHVGTHAHLAADILHQRPHERAPGRDRSLVNRLRLVRHKCALVDDAHRAGATAGRAGTIAVEGKLFRAKAVEALAADRADDRLLERHIHRRRDPVSVRTPIGADAGEQEPERVQRFCHRSEGRPDAW